MAKIIRSITTSGAAICIAMDATDIVEEARHVHDLSPTMTAALGRTLIAASLMGSTLKNKDDSITLRFCGDGACSTMIATSDYMGNVRGYASLPQLDLPPNSNGHLDVSGAIGKTGMLYVVKDIGLKEPYSGCVPFVSGEIAEDVTEYFAQSEQVPTVCALGVLINPDYSVKAAGGILIHLLPFAEEETVSQIEKNVDGIKSITSMLSEGYTVNKITEAFFKDIEFDTVDTYDVSYKCKCRRDFIEKMLISIGTDELISMAHQQDNTDVRCQFCNTLYSFTPKQIEKLVIFATDKG